MQRKGPAAVWMARRKTGVSHLYTQLNFFGLTMSVCEHQVYLEMRWEAGPAGNALCASSESRNTSEPLSFLVSLLGLGA